MRHCSTCNSSSLLLCQEPQEQLRAGRSSSAPAPRLQCQCQGPGAVAVLALSYSRSLHGHLRANDKVWAAEPGPAAVAAALLGSPSVGSDHTSLGTVPALTGLGQGLGQGTVSCGRGCGRSWAQLSASPAPHRGHGAAPSH